ncbi:MAG: ribbon-helix-helix protein, CopG family [Proteobacteria bacterium]|nr:ribbon-helix-helix protein, CopG family [Pseudomonadota bacterium]
MTKRIMKSNLITARVGNPLAKKLDYYAKIADRTRSWVIEDILKRYVDQEIAVVEAVNQGIASAERGELIPHEEVFRKLRIKSAERRKALRKNAA